MCTTRANYARIAESMGIQAPNASKLPPIVYEVERRRQSEEEINQRVNKMRDLRAKAAIPNLTDTSVGSTAASTSNTGVGSADTSTSGPSRRRRNYTSLYVSSNNIGANT